MLCRVADSAWLDTEQQQGTFVVVKPRSFPLRHKGHDMLGEPSCTSPRADAELDRLFANERDLNSMRALDQSACRHQHPYGDSTDKNLLLQQPTHQQAEFLPAADDMLATETTGMIQYTMSDLTALSEQPEHRIASHSNDCDLHALFSSRDDDVVLSAR